MSTPPITIRPMRTGEKPAVHRIVRRAFPFTQWIFFSWSPHVLVAERDGCLLGGTILKLVTLPGGRKGGYIAWLFTAPKARGQGVGQSLIEAALSFFEEQGCQEILAGVEGYNTSSSKIFATRGFSIMSPGEQFRRYGLGVFPLWVKLFHYIDIGHFLWVRPAVERSDRPVLQWVGSTFANILIALMATWSSGVNPTAFAAIPLMYILFFGLRTLGMWLVFQSYGIAVRYRAWESGFPLGASTSSGTGRYLPPQTQNPCR